ncbi:MAG: histidine phosphatase family protein [Planctomycetota bacterium]
MSGGCSTGDGQSVTGAFDAPTAGIMPSDAVTHLHLLRHGEVAGFTERRVRGHRDDPPSAAGRAQHAALAHWAAAQLPRPDVILCSDLARCRDLGEKLVAATGARLELDAALREQAMGAWEGRSWADLTREHGREVTSWWQDYANMRPPGGESLVDLAARVRSYREARLPALAGARVAIVTHIGVIRALLCDLLDVPLDQALRCSPAAASHTSLTLAESGVVVTALGERPWLAAGSPRPGAPTLSARPRVGLSGSSGTGKTTLGRRLADALGVPFLEERMRTRLQSGLDLHGLDLGDFRRLLVDLWEEQDVREREAKEGFVADRSVADHAAFWIHYGMIHDRAATEPWMERLLARLPDYERVLLFPWGVLPLADDGVRSTNRWAQFQFQVTLEGLLQRHLPAERLLRVPELPDLEQRLAQVLAALGRGP